MTPTSYSHPSRVGPVVISLREDGRWVITIGDEMFQGWHTPEAALSDLVDDVVGSSSAGDLSQLGLADSLLEWTPGPPR